MRSEWEEKQMSIKEFYLNTTSNIKVEGSILSEFMNL